MYTDWKSKNKKANKTNPKLSLFGVFSNTTVQKHQYFGAEPSSQSNLLGSWNGKQESRIAVAKRQGREKPAKIEQRKVRGPE